MGEGQAAMQVTPILLAGGSGTRLWPLSRKSHPKQFVPLAGSESLFQAAARRVSGSGYARPLVLTSDPHRFLVTGQLGTAGILPAAVLIEPEAKNTAPAVLAAALAARAVDPDAVLLVLPTDQVLPGQDAFHAALQTGLPAAAAGRIVLFGVAPNRPETGYGWLELADDNGDGSGPLPLRRFVEKPDRARAEAMLAAGGHLWNAGIVMARAKTLIAAFARHAPGLVPPAEAAFDAAEPDLGFLRLAPGPWAGAESISLDYAVLEKESGLLAVPLSGGWSDLGGWDAVWRAADRDASGTAIAGPATAIDCTDTLLRSDVPGLALVGLGLTRVAAVATRDAVLVADLDRAQDVREAVVALKAAGRYQAEATARAERPWGWRETLAEDGPGTGGMRINRLHLYPGAGIALQRHKERAEHWVVLAGHARLTRDGRAQDIGPAAAVSAAPGEWHRLENPGPDALEVIEIQVGGALDEGDVERPGNGS